MSEFDYIGYKFSSGRIGLSSRRIAKIKVRVSKIIYIHLLLHLRRNLFNPNRVGPGFYDWDLATCLNELRRYIYGDLKDSLLRSWIDSNVRIPRFTGLMTSYPLVTHVDQFTELDG